MGYKSKFKGAEIDARLEKMVNVTYAELVALRDKGELIAGQMYRMTDYETTCTWENTQVAGHPFDLVLTALDNKTLDEKCSAIWSDRDTDGYFANSNLAAWDVRYCLDNDTNRFDWAQLGGRIVTVEFNGVYPSGGSFGEVFTIDGVKYYSWVLKIEGEGILGLCEKEFPVVGDTMLLSPDGQHILGSGIVSNVQELSTGKGVIYSLTDERDNTCSCDFKNIMHSHNDEFVYTFHLDGADGSLTDENRYNKFVGCKNTFAIGSCFYCNIYNSRNVCIQEYGNELTIFDSDDIKLSRCENVHICFSSYRLDLTDVFSSRFDDNCGKITLDTCSSILVMSGVRDWTSSRVKNSIVLEDDQGNTIVKDLANL